MTTDETIQRIIREVAELPYDPLPGQADDEMRVTAGELAVILERELDRPPLPTTLELLREAGVVLDSAESSDQFWSMERSVWYARRDALLASIRKAIGECDHDWEQVNPNVIDGQRCMKCGAWK